LKIERHLKNIKKEKEDVELLVAKSKKTIREMELVH